MKKMGGINSILSMMPNMGIPDDLEVDDDAFKQTEAIICSMTAKEKAHPDIINPSRKKRIAKGAGVDIAEVNRLMKQYDQMKKMMKQMNGMMNGKKKKMFGLGGFGKGNKSPFGF
jgi:signal recognition particle subunit SRP54